MSRNFALVAVTEFNAAVAPVFNGEMMEATARFQDVGAPPTSRWWWVFAVITHGVVGWYCFGLYMRSLANQHLLDTIYDWKCWRGLGYLVALTPILNMVMAFIEWYIYSQHKKGGPVWTWKSLAQWRDCQGQQWLR